MAYAFRLFNNTLKCKYIPLLFFKYLTAKFIKNVRAKVLCIRVPHHNQNLFLSSTTAQ